MNDRSTHTAGRHITAPGVMQFCLGVVVPICLAPTTSEMTPLLMCASVVACFGIYHVIERHRLKVGLCVVMETFLCAGAIFLGLHS